MNLYSDNITNFEAPTAIEVNVRPNILYTDEYSYLTKDELEVLFLFATTEMSAEGFTSFSFSGIKRQLGKHQQKITKAVNRLLSKGLVTKNDIGYSLSPKGTTIISEIVKMQNAVDLAKGPEEYLQQSMIFTSKVPLDDIASMLVGKWFGSFRYISHTEGQSFVIRWQLVDSRSSATLHVYENNAILTIIPEKNNLQKFFYEQALDDLSHYIIEILNSLGIKSTIDFEGWRRSTISKIEYQQKLLSWLNTSNKTMSEN